MPRAVLFVALTLLAPAASQAVTLKHERRAGSTPAIWSSWATGRTGYVSLFLEGDGFTQSAPVTSRFLNGDGSSLTGPTQLGVVEYTGDFPGPSFADGSGLAFNRKRGEYLAAWSSNAPGPDLEEVWVRRLSVRGIPVEPGRVVTSSPENTTAVRPRLTYNPKDRGYLLTWRLFPDGGVRVRQLDPRGKPSGPVRRILRMDLETVSPLTRTGGYIGFANAHSAAGSFVVWLDQTGRLVKRKRLGGPGHTVRGAGDPKSGRMLVAICRSRDPAAPSCAYRALGHRGRFVGRSRSLGRVYEPRATFDRRSRLFLLRWAQGRNLFALRGQLVDLHGRPQGRGFKIHGDAPVGVVGPLSGRSGFMTVRLDGDVANPPYDLFTRRVFP